MRMDPPTAYVFPEAYDRIVVIKGPQTVLQGPGNSAATRVVRAQRQALRASRAPPARAACSARSFGRTDLVGDLRLGTPDVYGQLTGTRAESDDYTDGNGNDVHSRYLRWSGNAALGWTPDERTRAGIERGAERWRGGLRRSRDGRREVRARQRGSAVRADS